MFVRELILELHQLCGPITLYQDNKSTIILATSGRSNNWRSRHINVRYFHIHEQLQNGVITIEYVNTNQMIADMLTKVVIGNKFRNNAQSILNCAIEYNHSAGHV